MQDSQSLGASVSLFVHLIQEAALRGCCGFKQDSTCITTPRRWLLSDFSYYDAHRCDYPHIYKWKLNLILPDPWVPPSFCASVVLLEYYQYCIFAWSLKISIMIMSIVFEYQWPVTRLQTLTFLSLKNSVSSAGLELQCAFGGLPPIMRPLPSVLSLVPPRPLSPEHFLVIEPGMVFFSKFLIILGEFRARLLLPFIWDIPWLWAFSSGKAIFFLS